MSQRPWMWFSRLGEVETCANLVPGKGHVIPGDGAGIVLKWWLPELILYLFLFLSIATVAATPVTNCIIV